MRANSGFRQLPSGLWVPGLGTQEEIERAQTERLDTLERAGISRRVAIANSIKATLANDSVLVTPGSGATVATHLVGGKEHQVVMLATPSGHLWDTLPTYYFWSGFVAGAQNRKHLEIFNASGSGVKVTVRKMFVQNNMAAGTHIGQQWEAHKSSAVGTGGSTITGRAADSANAAIPAQVTCRAGPTGGATDAFTLFGFGVDGEETRPGAALGGLNNWIPEGQNVQEVVLNEDEGFYVQQITSSTVTVWGVLFVVSIA